MDIVIDILMGAGSIILAITPLLIPQVREFLIKGYQNSLDKALEDKKSKNERKNHVSKIRFDKEFEVYSELSSAFFELISNINSLIPFGGYQEPVDEDKKREQSKETYKNSVCMINQAIASLRKNAIFINKDTHDKYNELLVLCSKQLQRFEKQYQTNSTVTPNKNNILNEDDYERTHKINKKLDILNDELREYLQNLEVID